MPTRIDGRSAELDRITSQAREPNHRLKATLMRQKSRQQREACRGCFWEYQFARKAIPRSFARDSSFACKVKPSKARDFEVFTLAAPIPCQREDLEQEIRTHL